MKLNQCLSGPLGNQSKMICDTVPHLLNEPLTFIMRTTVLRAIMTSTVYSNEGDATKCHSLYWKVCLFWGM